MSQSNNYKTGKGQPICSLFDLFLDSLGGRQTNVNRRNYTHRLKKFLTMFGEKKPKDLTVQDVNAWHRDMMSLGHADPTNAGYRQALKAFLNWCVREGMIVSSPANHLTTGSYIPEEVKIPDEADVQAVVALALQWLKSDDYTIVRRAAVWLYQYEVGGRLGGLHFLRLKEIQRVLDAGSNRHGTYRVKSREKTGDVTHEFSETTARALRRMLELRPETVDLHLIVGCRKTRTKNDPVLRVRGLTKSGIQKDFRFICQAAGVKTIFPHSLRDRLGDRITRLYGPKIAAKKLNHSNITTTLNWYNRASQDDVSHVTQKMSPNSKKTRSNDLLDDFFKKAG